MGETTTIEKPTVEESVEENLGAVLQPPWNVILHDDAHHSYDYVIEMLTKLFRHSVEDAFAMACEVDNTGRVIVDTTTKERAELKRDQIHAYGPDWRIPDCKGSMSASIEPADD